MHLSPAFACPALFPSLPCHPAPSLPKTRTNPIASASPDQPSTPSPSLLSLAATAAAVTTLLTSPALPPPCEAATQSPLSQNTLTRRYLVTDSAALLRYSLPLDEASDPPVRTAQALLEQVGVDLRTRGAAGAAGLRRDLARLDAVLSERGVDMLLQVPAKRRADAAAALARLRENVARMEAEVGVGGGAGDGGGRGEFGLASKARETAQFVGAMAEASRKKPTAAATFDTAKAESLRNAALGSVLDLELIMVEDGGLPFRIPRRYDALPRLEGRAEVEMRIRHGENARRDGDSSDARVSTVTLTLDGYSAPLNAGNMVDLVQRGVYDGTPIQASQRGFFLQFGNKDGEFVDSDSGKRRSVPMEVMVAGERSPLYGMTLDDAGIGDLQPVLPITAFGAVASHHSTENVNDASSLWYVFLFDPKSNQARSMGGNALNGSISGFGYVTGGADVLPNLRAGDLVEKVSITRGLEHFRPSADAPKNA